MALTSRIGVWLGNYTFKRFDYYTSHAMETQEKILMRIVHENENCELGKKYDFKNIHSIEDFQAKVPLLTFEDYAPLVDRMIDNDEKNIITSKKILRYCASSGSVGKPKLQPKTWKDIWSMQCCGFAATPGCADRYFRRLGKFKHLPAQRGPVMMSMNGHRLKNGMMSNGAAQVPFNLLRPILKFFITTPDDILFPEDEENTNINYFQLRFCLVDRNVTFLGSMVITMMATAFEYLEKNWRMICNDIEHGTIDPSVKCPDSLRKKYGHMKPNPKRAAELRAVFEEGFDTDVPVAYRIWPKLCWGYGMISSTLSVYMEGLKRYIGDLPMHNMGYAASEGYMAMPVELNASDYVLLPRSLFYEFLPEDATEDDKPVTLDKLEVGKNYEIIVTNYSGLYRYRILDIVKCTGTYNQSKKIEFLYRSNMGLNIANEKTTTQMLDFVADAIQQKFGLSLEAYSYYSDLEGAELPRYALYLECDHVLPAEQLREIEAYMDEQFRAVNEKYDKYRRWGMIGNPNVRSFIPGTIAEYKQGLVAQGRPLNQIKPVTVTNTPEKKDFFLSHLAE